MTKVKNKHIKVLETRKYKIKFNMIYAHIVFWFHLFGGFLFTVAGVAGHDPGRGPDLWTQHPQLFRTVFLVWIIPYAAFLSLLGIQSLFVYPFVKVEKLPVEERRKKAQALADEADKLFRELDE